MLIWTMCRRALQSSPLSRALLLLGAILFALPLGSVSGQVQQSCVDCTLYARTELNLRQDPNINAPVLRFVPAGSAVHRSAGKDVDTYAPVTFDGVSGWVVALGLVNSPNEVEVGGPSTAAPVVPAPVNTDQRVTLEPLILRDGPSSDAEPIVVMPAGEPVILTREGAENGYVTVDYGGELGWAYADLLGGEPKS